MISIFFSSKKPDPDYINHIMANCVTENPEIEGIENPGLYSLSEVYNQCIGKAKYNIILLIHDDLILSKGFDKKILNHFKSNEEYGILGLAGTNIIPESGIWWEKRHLMTGRVWHQHENNTYESRYSPLKNRITEVATVDGLFIALDKNKIKYGFDERLDGFHFYDLAFCLLNSKEHIKIGVVPDIKVVHKSIGEIDDGWKELKTRFIELFKDNLPYEIKPLLYVDKEIKSKKNNDLVSIIIPSKDNFNVLNDCVQSILELTKHEQYEILIADTGSNEETLNKLRELGDNNEKVRIVYYDYYHYGKINNDAVKQHSQGKYLVFCNDDIVFKNDVVSKMLEINKDNRNCGTIGARLHYPDGKIQHGGIEMLFSQSKKRSQLTHAGLKSYHGASEERIKGVLGNTAALMMIEKKLFNKIGGFIENNTEAFEDLILNIECIKLNKKNIYCGNLVAIHYESTSRGDKKQKGEQEDMANIVNPYLKENLKIII